MTYEFIIPILALIITIGIFSYTQWQRKIIDEDRKKIDSAHLTLDLTNRFYDPDIKGTRTKINNAIDMKHDLEIVNASESEPTKDECFKITGSELEEYLNELEQIGLFVNKGVLDETFAYEMFGYPICSVWEYPKIKEYIKDQRDEQDDLWNQFEKAYDLFKPIRDDAKLKSMRKKHSENEKD